MSVPSSDYIDLELTSSPSETNILSLDGLTFVHEHCTDPYCSCHRKHKRLDDDDQEDGFINPSIFGGKGPRYPLKRLQPEPVGRTPRLKDNKQMLRPSRFVRRLPPTKPSGSRRTSDEQGPSPPGERAFGETSSGLSAFGETSSGLSAFAQIAALGNVSGSTDLVSTFTSQAFHGFRSDTAGLVFGSNSSSANQTDLQVGPTGPVCPRVPSSSGMVCSSNSSGNLAGQGAAWPATTCSQQALLDDCSIDELSSYFEDFCHIPRKMSAMAEMMYT